MTSGKWVQVGARGDLTCNVALSLSCVLCGGRLVGGVGGGTGLQKFQARKPYAHLCRGEVFLHSPLGTELGS